MAGMTISDNGIKHLQQSEGSRLKAYLDQGNVWTIGFGHTGMVNGVPIHKGMTITKEQEAELLKRDISYFENYVNRRAKRPMTQNQFDAIVNLVYSVGEGNLNKSSFWGHFNNGNDTLASEAILAFNKSRQNGEKKPSFNQGLMNRRLREKALFLGEQEDSSLWQMPPVQSIQPTEQVPQWLNAFSPPKEEQPTNPLQAFTDGFNQLNGTLDAFAPPEEPAIDYKKKYQKELANAFGVEPSTKDMIPDHIGDLVRSIYDKTT